MLSKELYNMEERHVSMTYVPQPVTRKCATCLASIWGNPASHHVDVRKGKMYCITQRKEVDPDDPPCNRYVGFNKKNTLYVDVCWRDEHGRELSTAVVVGKNGRRGKWVYR